MSNYPSTGRAAAPRFEVCSISGYNAGVGGKLTTSYWVADRDYSFREVAKFYSAPTGVPRPADRLRRALERCAELNAEHDAWVALGRL